MFAENGKNDGSGSEVVDDDDIDEGRTFAESGEIFFSVVMSRSLDGVAVCFEVVGILRLRKSGSFFKDPNLHGEFVGFALFPDAVWGR